MGLGGARPAAAKVASLPYCGVSGLPPGWSLLGHFDLADEAWWDEFYGPMERRIDALRVRHADDPEALAALDVLAAEPQMHRRSGHHYGYTFFISRLGGDPFPASAG